MVRSAPRGPQAGGRPTCEPCRQRKVRCNRQTPCSQCSRLQLTCIYETRKRRAPLKAPSKDSLSRDSLRRSFSRTPTDPEYGPTHEANDQPTNKDILDRLNKIEGLLSVLTKSLDHGQLSNAVVRPSQAAPSQTAPMAVLVPPAQPGEETAIGERARGSYVDDSMFLRLFLDGISREKSGKLVSMASANSLNKPTHCPPVQPGFAVTDAFGSQVDNLSISPQLYGKLWTLYVQNFDPLVKLLHIPTAQSVVLNAFTNFRNADDTTLTLVYAIAFAATATLSKSSSVHHLGCEKSTLLRHFMQQMDKTFMRSQFLLRPNTESLTALVIYLTALRNYDTSRPVWILTGLAMRVAESLGLHEDGSRLGLDPFESETRRRLWWHLTALDATAPENHGFNSTFVDRDRTFFLPNNIDDVDISPGMVGTPIGKEQWTEMSFSIMNLDLCRSLRRTVAPTNKDDNDLKSEMIDQTERKIRQKWLQFADLTKPICRAADALLQISVLKAHFILSLQTWLSNTPDTESKYCHLPQSTFATAIKLLEDGYLLQSGKLFPDFAWFYQQHPQLYALFLVLRTLYASPGRAETDRAWIAVDNYFTCLTEFEEASDMRGRTSCVWAALGPLRERARESWSQGARPHLASAERKSTSLPMDLENAGAQVNDGPASPFAGTEPNEQMVFRSSQLALEPAAFDNILAWQDFSDWFSTDTGPL